MTKCRETDVSPHVDKGATFRGDEFYRYHLWRRWATGPKTPDFGRHATFIMLNPSTANADIDDPTIRKCCKFAKRWGYAGIEVVNLFAWRTIFPRDLYNTLRPIGEHNDETIRAWSFASSLVVCAWGNHGGLHRRSHDVLRLLREWNCVPYALSVTKQDQPGHPLYLRDDAEPFIWDERDRSYSR